MSLLIRPPETLPCADGTTMRLAVLGPDGLEALFVRGWSALCAEIGEADCWFSSAQRLALRDGPLRVSDTEPFLVDASAPADGAFAFLLYAHAGVRGFDGHFPDQPILPGVVQVDWAARLAARCGYPSERFAGLSRLKFNAPVRPGAVLRLRLVPGSGRLDFRFALHGGIATSGSLHYTGAP